MKNLQTVNRNNQRGSGKTAIIIALVTVVAFLVLLIHFNYNLNSNMITLHTTMGDIVIELNDEKAPVTSQNFKQYCQDGFYDGLIFHRVIDNFMVQGGGMDENMNEKPSRDAIQNEADNSLPNVIGSIAMARTSDPHSASSQFFINVNDNSFLNHKSKDTQGWGYAVFAQVVEGMDVVEKIKKVKTGRNGYHDDVPLKPIIINSTSC